MMPGVTKNMQKAFLKTGDHSNSVNRKVSIIDDILDLAFTGTLKTELSITKTSTDRLKPELESDVNKRSGLYNASNFVKPDIDEKTPKNPKWQASIFLIVLPIAYVIISIVGFVLIFGNRPTINVFDLQNFAFYSMIIFWAGMGSYAWKFKKISTSKEYFQRLPYDYIIAERLFLNKIRTAGIAVVIVFLIILIIVSLIHGKTSKISIIDWILFSLCFGLFDIVMFSYAKIVDQEKKKHFKLFMASGFCKQCLTNDDLKAKYMTDALHWYSDFFRKTHHRGLKNIDKIAIRTLASSSSSSIIEELVINFESGDEYAPVNKIAKIMDVNVDELFEDETFIQKIKDLILQLGAIAAVGSLLVMLATLLMQHQ